MKNTSFFKRPLRALLAVAFAAGANLAHAGSVLPSDTVLVPPKNNGPIIAPIAGFNWHTRSDNSQAEVPMYKNVDRDSDDYWNAIIDEMLLARVHMVLWHGRYCDSLTSGTSGRGDMCPRWLTKYVDAAKRAGAENILKAGYFDDTGNYPNAAGVSRFDLANTRNWTYFWDHRMKIWFDTVPKNMWYLLDGKPVIVFWNLKNSSFINQQGNASKLLTWLKNNFIARYGMEPAFILEDDWFQNDTTISKSQATGVHSWFSPKTDIASSIYTYTDFNGAKWGALAPAYSKTDRTVSRRDGATLDLALAKGLGAKFIIMESWTNWAENAGFYRSNSWSYPNQYIGITRKYAEPEPQTLRFQAEAADRFNNPGNTNQGGQYADRGLDVGRLADGSGWYVGWIKAGEWLEYENIQLAKDTYRFTARIATDSPGKKMHLVVGNVSLPAVELPNTGGLGSYQLVHLGEVPLDAGVQNVRLVFDTSGGLNVDWFFLKRGGASPSPVVDPNAYYNVRAKISGKVLDVEGASTANGANVQQWALYSANDNQKWQFKDAGDGYYYVVAKHSGKVLDVKGASTADGANVQQWTLYTANNNQKWKLQDAGDGYYYFVAKHSGKVLDVPGGSADNGTGILQWTLNGGDNQKWKLEKIN